MQHCRIKENVNHTLEHTARKVMCLCNSSHDEIDCRQDDFIHKGDGSIWYAVASVGTAAAPQQVVQFNFLIKTESNEN